MVLLTILLFSLSPLPVFAGIHLCKFSSQTTTDWVQVCNDSDQIQDLSTYIVEDAIGNSTNLDCFLSSQKSYSFSFSKYLNKDGDFILLKNGSDIIDCVSYGNQNCSINDIHTPAPLVDHCFSFATSWENTIDCSCSGATNCQTPTSLPTLSPIPTFTSTPSLTPSPTPNASPNIAITFLPASAALGQSFGLNFSLNNIKPQTEYYFKAYEDSDTDKSLEVLVNGSWQASYKSASWDSLPKFSSDSSSLNQSLEIRANPDKSSGDYQIYLKVALVSDTNQSYLSSSKTISISPLSPSATPTPTSSLSPSPSIPFSPSPSSSPTATETEVPVSDSAVLGLQDISASPTPSPSKKPFFVSNFLPKLFIGLGVLFLLLPPLLAKLKK